MKIATVIVSYRKGEQLSECISSLKKSKLNTAENTIIIIDNTKVNLGFAGGNNKGIQQALEQKADAILLLNDDTKVDTFAIERLADTLFSDSHIGIVVPKIYFYPRYEYHKDRYAGIDQGKVIWYAGGSIDWNNVVGIHRGVDEVDHGQYDRQEKVEFATGCCLLIRKEVFQKVGLLDEKYFLYLEDLDFNVRVKQAGYQIIYEPRAIIWHKNAQSSGSGSELHDYFFTRNRLLFGMTYAKLRTRFALLREAIKLLVSGPLWKKRAVHDFLLGRLGKGSWGK